LFYERWAEWIPTVTGLLMLICNCFCVYFFNTGNICYDDLFYSHCIAIFRYPLLIQYTPESVAVKANSVISVRGSFRKKYPSIMAIKGLMYAYKEETPMGKCFRAYTKLE